MQRIGPATPNGYVDAVADRRVLAPERVEDRLQRRSVRVAPANMPSACGRLAAPALEITSETAAAAVKTAQPATLAFSPRRW